MAREGQGYPCYQRDMMMISHHACIERLVDMYKFLFLFVTNLEKLEKMLNLVQV